MDAPRSPGERMPATREACLAADAADPLAEHRDAFVLRDGLIYLDGNSLGALPRATPARVREVVETEWGHDLIGSWDAAGWIDAPRRVGSKIARLVGAADDEVICADSTSVNLFKVLSAALRLQRAADPGRDVILSERGNFPTDLYIAQTIAENSGGRYRLLTVPAGEIAARLDPRTAVLLLTHVNYRSGRMHDLLTLTQAAHGAGALAVWDLAHSAGAVPVDLNAAGADFAVGCGYKYLNGGPGAPAFVFAARRHLEAMAGDRFAQPLAGWLGHRAPFEFAPQYEPAAGIDRFGAGTPSILALAALDCGVDTVLAAGVTRLREKSVQLTQLFIELVDSRCDGLGLTLLSPRDPAQRGSQVCYAHQHAWPVMQALIARGVVGDVRASDAGEPAILRFGFAPLYLRFADVWDAVEALRDVLLTRAWDQPQFARAKAVT
jgi:kynureninase